MELQKDDNDFISEFDYTQRKQFRKRMIESILATDMAKHFPKVSQFLQMLSQNSIRGGLNNELLINKETPEKIFDT